MKKIIPVLLFFCLKSFSQDTLPKFSLVTLKGEKAQISWTNPFTNCIQLSIQKSYDSLRFFQTVFSTPSPELPQNGYIDNNYIPQIKTYYRIFFVLDDGNYFFTESKSVPKYTQQTFIKPKPTASEVKRTNQIIDSTSKPVNLITPPNPGALPAKRIFSVYKRSTDSLVKVLDEVKFYRFKDSIATKTKDTLFSYDNDIIIWKPFVPKPLWKASTNIFTTDKGYLQIVLSKAKQHKYQIIFFDESNHEIFSIKQVKQEKLILEKSNFTHAGLFYFKLYEDGVLIEENKFYIDNDF
ncbi:MAG: hypothetical protein ACOVO1_10865 [Chitinophagaceae bacterium]